MSETIQLVEKHIVKSTDPRFELIDAAAFASKNLYNLANYMVRQEFIHNQKYIRFESLYHQIKDSDAYRALPRKVSQLVLKQVDHDWQSFFAAISVWKTNPDKFLGRPKLPGYKDKLKGRNLLVYNDQALSRTALKKGFVKPSGLNVTIETNHHHINQVRIVPRKHHYIVEIVYPVKIEPNPMLDKSLIAGIDIGLNNLAALTSNKPGFVPLVVNGRPLKSINQFYNKRKAELQSQLKGNRHSSKRIDRLTDRRNLKVNHYLHNASRQIVDHLVAEGIGTLVIGKNPNWKQEINIGRRNNQNFVQIPHARFVDMLSYKARIAAIQVVITEESYTSKCSFLDLETIQKQDSYAGRRVKRGLFRASNGRHINADVNGSFNIIRKVAPDAFGEGVVDIVVHPLGFAPING